MAQGVAQMCFQIGTQRRLRHRRPQAFGRLDGAAFGQGQKPQNHGAIQTGLRHLGFAAGFG